MALCGWHLRQPKFSQAAAVQLKASAVEVVRLKQAGLATASQLAAVALLLLQLSLRTRFLAEEVSLALLPLALQALETKAC